MAIHLDHTIVPARDKVVSATFFARIFGLEYNGPHSHFAPVQVNQQLTFDFDERGEFEPHHYAFKIGDAEFEAIFARVKEAEIPYGSGPRSRADIWPHGPESAARAAATAASTSSRVPDATSAMVSSVAGFTTGITAPAAASRHSPLINSCFRPRFIKRTPLRAASA